jgi:precorrin-2/cobalt-factor-2 C20-methyltransferase
VQPKNSEYTDTQNPKWGTLYCIGTGPGDPELITLKAWRLLQAAPLICVPRNAASGNTQALEIVRQYVDENRQQIEFLDFPMVRDAAKLAAAWDSAMQTVAKLLAEGRDVVFPVLGDPLLYGTFNYLLERVAESYPAIKIVVVPGITSIGAATATALLPLCEAEERVAILPALYQDNPAQFRQSLHEYDTVVLMKVGSALERLLPLLEAEGRLEKAFFVERLGMSGERIVRGAEIAELRNSKLHYFSLLIVKK